MSFDSTLFIAFGVIAYVIYLVLEHRLSQLAQLPGPPRDNWVLGTLPGALRTGQVGEKLSEWGAKYGRTYVVDNLFGTRCIVTSDKAAINHCFSNVFTWGHTAPVKRLVKGILGSGILTTNGAAHKNERRILSPAFSIAHINALTPDVRMMALRLRSLWVDIIDTSHSRSADGSVEINVYDWLSRTLFDNIGYCGFGHDFHSLVPVTVQSEDRLNAAFRTMFQYMAGTPMAIAEALFPPLKLLPTRRRKLVRSSEDYIYSRLQELLDGKRTEILASMQGGELKKQDVTGKDLLSLLLRANMASDVKPGERLSDYNIVRQAALFIGAGYETTSNTLTFCTLALAKYPSVQDRLRQELLACGGLEEDNDITYSTIGDMKYLDAVVNETFRLFPPGDFNGRTAYQADVVPLSEPVKLKSGEVISTLPVRRGDMVMVPHSNWDASVWGADVMEFKPERWFQLTEGQEGLLGWNHLSTFAYGPKNCIGLRFAALQLKVLLATICRSFVFTPSPRTAKIVRKTKIVTKPYVEGEEDAPQAPVLVRRFVSVQ